MKRLLAILIIISILLISSCTTDSTKFGVISDIQGESLENIITQFHTYQLHGVIVAGDISDMHNDLDDYDEIYNSLEQLLELQVPLFVIPGNHESQEDYYNAINAINNSNIIDMSKGRVVEYKNINMISLPGYNIEDYVIKDGFLYNDSEILFLEELVNKSLINILISHNPAKGTHEHSIDTITTGENVGNELLREVMLNNNINFAVFGHIHEAGG